VSTSFITASATVFAIYAHTIQDANIATSVSASSFVATYISTSSVLTTYAFEIAALSPSIIIATIILFDASYTIPLYTINTVSTAPISFSVWHTQGQDIA
jgi:hypothetical protein